MRRILIDRKAVKVRLEFFEDGETRIEEQTISFEQLVDLLEKSRMKGMVSDPEMLTVPNRVLMHVENLSVPVVLSLAWVTAALPYGSKDNMAVLTFRKEYEGAVLVDE